MERTNSTVESPRAVQPLADLIDQIMGRFGLLKNYHGWQVVTRWHEIVGEQYASRAQAVRFSEGVLYVAIEDAVWRQTFSLQTSDVLKKIHEYPFGRTVRNIRLVMGEKRTNDNADSGA